MKYSGVRAYSCGRIQINHRSTRYSEIAMTLPEYLLYTINDLSTQREVHTMKNALLSKK